MKTILLFITCLFFSSPAVSAVSGQEITYTSGPTTLRGYLATDTSLTGQRPGILVVHEWWGHNSYARRRADMLAELGYTALAVDMYGDGKQADHPADAGKFAAQVRNNMPEARARFTAALDVLKAQPSVDPGRIGAIGYCFGGGIVLEMARAGLDLDGVVSFHGSLSPSAPAQPGAVKARILVLKGADDRFVSAEQIAAFKKEMEAAGADYRFVNYPGAMHSFTNPDADDFARKFDLPLAYNAEADRQSWQEMQSFFRALFNRD